jgi:hypothetical protein
LRVRTDSGTETPIIGIERWTGRDLGIGFATYVGGGDFVCAVRDERSVGGVDENAAKLVVGRTVVVVAGVVVVVVAAEIAGVTGMVVVVVEVVGDGTTIPEGGNETTPMDEVRVGPLGGLWGTKITPKIPIATKARETAHHSICGGRFSFRDFTSPNLV